MAHPVRPVIGINADFVAATKQSVALAKLPIAYAQSVYAAGGMPVFLPSLGKDIELDCILDRLDGVILSGGDDLDPRRHNQPNHVSVKPIAERREESDKCLIRRVVERQMPLLAIGLGMQHLNVVCGGNLFVHIPEDVPRAMPHRDRTEGPHRHAVKIHPNTRLDEIYGGEELLVNSDHHQAVKQVSPKFKVAAVAPDGVIEAIESTDMNWFCVGVQWHPESETASALDMQLMEAFMQSCVQQSKTLQAAA